MIPNRVTLAQALEMPIQELAQLPTELLAILLEENGEVKAFATQCADKLHAAMEAKFGPIADERRQAEGKDTGRVSFDDGEFVIRADRPKHVEWDQEALDRAIEVVTSWGESPRDFVTVKLAVPENKYKAWPTTIRKVFEPARVVSTGKPSYTIGRRAA